jgi:RNA polymerase sigma-70 factor (ECF subfamily)
MNPLMDTQEAEAMRRLRQGDLSSIELIYRLYVLRLKSFVMKKNPAFDETKADDVVQLTFIALTRQASDRPGSFEHFTRLGNLLFTIATSIVIDLQRNEERDEKLKQHVAEYRKQPLRPDERALGKERHRMVHWAMRLLPKKLQEAVALHYLEGMSVKQTADATETSVNTTKKRINRSRHDLRRSLHSYWKGGKQ